MTVVSKDEAEPWLQYAPEDQKIVKSVKAGDNLSRNDDDGKDLNATLADAAAAAEESDGIDDICSLHWVRTILLATARTTLRHLIIFAPKNLFLGSLQEFKVLESVVTDRTLLLEKARSSWAHLFPPTIRSLTIYDNHYSNPEHEYSSILQDEVIVLLEDLLRTKVDELPHLGKVNYFLSRELPRRRNGLRGVKNHMSVRVVKKLEKRFSNYGMQLSLQDEYHPYWERMRAKKMPWARS